MFGQTRPLFGGTTTTGFGGGTTFGANTSTGFGQSAFGAKPTGTAAPTFQGSTFGSSAPMFGSAAPATSQPSGSLFGTPAPAFGAQPTQGFGTATSTGGFGGFGAGTTGGMFGSTAPNTGLFGTPQAAPTATSTQGGLFGASTSTTFGAQKPAFGGFGTGTSTGGLFGQTQTQPAQSTSIFGQPPTPAVTGGTLFGSSFGTSAAAGPTGTAVKFNPPIGTDSMMKNNIQTNVSTRHQCISCMKEYENKSLEELRFEDYALGRKGPAAGTQQTGLFGAAAPAPSGGLFGTPAAATQQKPLFGSTTTTGFGGGTSLFGQQQQPAGGSLFGKPATSTAPTTGFGFGQTQQQPSTGLFGQQPQQQQPAFGATTSVFGAPATSQPSTGVFGAAAPSTGFAFGATSQPQQSTGLFGAAKPAFGATTTTSSFGFGQPTPTSTAGGLFGAKPATGGFGTTPAFGTPASSAGTTFGGFGSGTGLFGSTAPSAGTSAFGAKPAAPTFGFGTSTAPTSTGFSFGQTSGGSLFGATSTAATAAKPGGLFGTTAPFGGGTTFGTLPGTGSTGLGTLGAGTGTSLGFGAGSGIMGGGTFGAAQAAPPAAASLPVHQYILTLAECSQTGDNPIFRKILESSGKREEVIKASAPSAATPPEYKVTPRPATKLRTKPLLNGSLNGGKKSLFEDMGQEDGWDSGDRDTGKDFFVPRRGSKKFQLKAFLSGGSFTTGDEQTSQTGTAGTLSEVVTSPSEEAPKTVPPMRNRPDLDDSLTALNVRRPALSSSILDNTSGLGEAEVTTCEEEIVEERQYVEPPPPHPVGVKLRRTGYYTVPSLEELAEKGLDADGRCVVESFIVGRENYGFIQFEEPVDVANVDLDSIVVFRHKEVTVYPDDTKKPPKGQELNRRAEITLHRVWPVDKSTGEYIKDPERLAALRYEERLERAAHKNGARFVEYRPETGSWTFKVNHFSSYGLE